MLSRPRKLLVLDLDETLIYAVQKPLARPADFQLSSYYVYKRPHLDTFLEDCFVQFEVAVWTSASPHYAERMTAVIFTKHSPLFIWSAERCGVGFDSERGEYYPRKNIKKLRRRSYAFTQIIAVDDSPEKWEDSYGNLVRVRPFYGDENDNELMLLSRYLGTLKDVVNVRAVEKRGWREAFPPPNPDA